MRNYQSRILKTQEMNRLIEFSESSISESDMFEDSFEFKNRKISAFNTSDYKAELLTQTSTKRPRPMSQEKPFLCDYMCIECEKKDKIISDLRLELKNTKSQAVLTEKHLKQYDNLLKFKDKRLQDEEKRINQKKIEIEEKKSFISNAIEEIQLEKSRIAVDLQRLVKGQQDLDAQSRLIDEKKYQLEELFKEYLDRKSDYLNFTQNHEIASTSLVESLLLKREEEIQSLINEVYSNKAEIDHSRKCETQADFYNDSRSEKKSIKHGNLKKIQNELKHIKEIVQKERAEQRQLFEAKMETLRAKEKKIQTEKEKIIEAQKMLNNEIQAIERIKRKIAARRKSPAISKNSSNFSVIHRRTESQDSLSKVNIIPDSELTKLPSCSELEDRLKASHLKTKDLEFQLEQSEKQLQDLLMQVQSLELAAKDHESREQELSNLLIASEKENRDLQDKLSTTSQELQEQKTKQPDQSIQENMLRLRIAQLENLITVEGGKLQNEIEVLKEEKNLLNEKIEKLNEENNDLVNECDFITNEKEKFRKISESLHNHLNQIDSDSEQSESVDSEINEIKTELEEKLSQVKKKEAELHFFEERLNAEREKITHSAEYIKSLSEDMNLQKKLLEKELENLKNEKIKFANLSKRLEEKSQVLAAKEKELFNLKNKLEEREKLIHSKTTVI